MRKQILDHGYLEFIEGWGSDECIVEAARMSTGKGFLRWDAGECPVCEGGGKLYSGQYSQMEVACEACGGKGHVPGDEKLLRFLWGNKHHTPFEMAGMTVEAQAPILVFREWHRHRVPFGYNEMSARYTPLPDVNYIPSVERLMAGSDGKNKQAGTIAGSEVLTRKNAESFREGLDLVYRNAQALYETALANGVPKELARVHLPVGRYSRMRATSNLRGWLAFLVLRMAKSAQLEIREYANAVGDLIAERFPRTWGLFVESREDK